MESLVSKITTVVLLGAFSILAALKLSDSLITNNVVTDKNLATLLAFFAALVFAIIVVVAVFKVFARTTKNEVKIKGSGNKTHQDIGKEKEKKTKNNTLDIEGNDNSTYQDKH